MKHTERRSVVAQIWRNYRAVADELKLQSPEIEKLKNLDHVDEARPMLGVFPAEILRELMDTELESPAVSKSLKEILNLITTGTKGRTGLNGRQHEVDDRGDIAYLLFMIVQCLEMEFDTPTSSLGSKPIRKVMKADPWKAGDYPHLDIPLGL